ncbi:hypothetical protein H696_03273 [Fonticula alba]|uniref:Uncharacterized protein n=1 Tax=Fonticula alba TaxID=691883 RepID=A0A058Z7A5_FONAL|nr:hypothetical protein H696_03273 [Fonticula alba]KCV69813.1 hypothetical protein H696_03273 [Fonticula alba]|eukprot:XP_009495419.1 hypothetical protein H696_03273 [Fonticula alba]
MGPTQAAGPPATAPVSTRLLLPALARARPSAGPAAGRALALPPAMFDCWLPACLALGLTLPPASPAPGLGAAQAGAGTSGTPVARIQRTGGTCPALAGLGARHGCAACLSATGTLAAGGAPPGTAAASTSLATPRRAEGFRPGFNSAGLGRIGRMCRVAGRVLNRRMPPAVTAPTGNMAAGATPVR